MTSAIPIELWLAAADRRRRNDIVIIWDRLPDHLAILPCGIKWDAIRTPAGVGRVALEKLLGGPEQATIGPVLQDHPSSTLYWLTPIDAAAEAMPAGTQRLSRGHHLAAPAPNRGITHPAEWVHLPTLAGILTPPHPLAAALRAAANDRSSA